MSRCPAAAGARLHGMVLTKSMFVATEMVAGGEVAFEHWGDDA